MKTTLAIPSIHLNGTSKDSLLEQLQDAATAIEKACGFLNEAAPHGRDYYVQGPDAYSVAARQHEKRIEKLREVKKELAEIFDAVYDGGFKRTA